MDAFVTMNHAADHGDRPPKSALLAGPSSAAYGPGSRGMALGGSLFGQGTHFGHTEGTVKAADVSDWDPAATLAALSGTSNEQSAAGLLAELGSVAGESQPSMSASASAGTYADLRIKFVDQVRRRLPCLRPKPAILPFAMPHPK
jgi:hypothetical protein